MVGTLEMPPSQFELLTRQISDLSSRVEMLAADLAGDADRVGVYGRVRNLEAWKNEHISTHDAGTLDRRMVARDWRTFWLRIIEHGVAVLIGAAVTLLMFALTGQLARLP